MEDSMIVQVSESEFDSEVLKSSVPVLVDFYADWCGPCKIVEPMMEVLSKEYSGKVKFVKVNVDDNQRISMRYDIMSIPTAIIFEKGKVKDSLIGAFPATAYRQRIDRALKA